MGTLTMNVAQLAEAVYLGMLGTEALAAMGFAFPLTITLFAFAGGIGSGASSVIARAMGAGERAQASILVTHAQILSVVVGVVLAVTGFTYAYEIVSTLGAQDLVLELTVDYLRVYIWHLRRKIEPNPKNPVYLINELNTGYRFEPQA